jgi:hypothetical protein
LFLHAAVIASRAGDEAGARTYLEKARALDHLLWPSERKQLGAPNSDSARSQPADRDAEQYLTESSSR